MFADTFVISFIIQVETQRTGRSATSNIWKVCQYAYRQVYQDMCLHYVDVRYELREAMKGKLAASILFVVVSLLVF